MEKDTVLLSVETYNELRDFKKKIEEGKTLRITQGFGYYNQEFITTEKAIEIIAELNKSLAEEIERLNKSLAEEIERLNKSLTEKNEKLSDTNKPKEVTVEAIKKMSYWEFRKWRKS